MTAKITFIGFGEAAQSIVTGLMETGAVAINVYDIRFNDPAALPKLKEKADAIGAAMFTDLGEAVAGAELVVSAVVGSVAVKVAEGAAAVLKPGQVYMDINSVSPKTKREAEAAIVASGAGFVEAAVMARVPPFGHKVPMLLAGAPAAVLAAQLSGFGMKVEHVGDRVGQASVVKMLRSIMIKGVEALLMESLAAASRFDMEERILDSISETFPGLDWRETASYYLGRTVIHGARRVTEMSEVVETLKELDMEPIMAEAAGRRIGWGFEVLRDAHWRDGTPSDYREILDALKAKARAEKA